MMQRHEPAFRSVFAGDVFHRRAASVENIPCTPACDWWPASSTTLFQSSSQSKTQPVQPGAFQI